MDWNVLPVDSPENVSLDSLNEFELARALQERDLHKPQTLNTDSLNSGSKAESGASKRAAS